jgi:cytochrome P450
MKVYINSASMHYSSAIWGPDALSFRPSRWLPSTSASTSAAAPTTDTLFTPPRGTYLPWSGGPRACPGQKMSQVEFVTTFATLFRKCTVEPVLMNGESRTEMKKRLENIMQDSNVRLTLQMNRLQEVKLRWARR